MYRVSQKVDMFEPPVRDEDVCALGNDWRSRGFLDSICVRRQAEAPKFRPRQNKRSVLPRFQVPAQRKEEILDLDGNLNDDFVFETPEELKLSREELEPLIEQMKSLSVDVYDHVDEAKNEKLTADERGNEYGEFVEELDFPEERDEWEDEEKRAEREQRVSRCRDAWIRRKREDEIEDVLDCAWDVEEGIRIQKQIEEEQRGECDDVKLVQMLLTKFRV